MKHARFASTLAGLAAFSCLASVAPTAQAFRGGAAVEVAPGEAAVRVEPRVRHGAPPPARAAAFARLVAETGHAGWRALWDDDTLAPLRVYGGFIEAPGAVASPAVAETHAAAFLARHADLLAPSSAPGAFVLLANDLDRGLRTVTFAQRVRVPGVGWVPVPGASVSFLYKNDRLFVLGSEATAQASLPAASLPAAAATSAALGWAGATHALATAAGSPELVALRLVRAGGETLRLAYQVDVSASAPREAYDVFVDAVTGLPISRASRLRFATEDVAIDAPVRGPEGQRMNYPAELESVLVGGVANATDVNGVLTWTDPTATTLATQAAGQYVVVANQGGLPASGQFTLADGGSVVWSMAADEFGDAQLSGYVHANRIKDHARGIVPGMPFLADVLPVNANVADAQGCNAFWDGSALNFFRQNDICSNTARIADVVYHEFGHGFHQNSIIPGVGQLDPSLGEGTGDYMAVTTTGDPNVAPGFFLGDPMMPLRKIDSGRRWPEDISQDPHETGLIWAGSMWDLRTYLSEDLGAAAGVALADQLYAQAIRRASNIPTTYVEVLAADDDDGDLGNGTPHVCEIERAFSAHGLAEGLDATGLSIHHAPLDLVSGDAPYPVAIDVVRTHPECPHGVGLDDVAIVFDANGQPPATIPLSKKGDQYVGSIPSLPAGTVFGYHVTARSGDSTMTLPDNRADPDYHVFAGETVVLYCNDFEHDVDGWTFTTTSLAVTDFAWGAPEGLGGDPAKAYGGKKVIGTKLDGGGTYTQGRHSIARSPIIDLKGHSKVHLQLRRWLTVEDGFYDHATISANGVVVWQNVGTNESDGSLDLVDKEWRFLDVDLAGVGTDSVQIDIGLEADQMLNLGGWNVDDFCVVAVKDVPAASSSSGAGGGGGTTGPESDGGGCGCRVNGGDAPAGETVFGVLALASFVRRRRSARRRVI